MSAFDSEGLAQVTAAAPAWRQPLMESAYRVFAALEEPTGAEEDWRYVDFEPRFDDLAPAMTPGAPLPGGPFLAAMPKRDGHVSIVDGAVVHVDSGVAQVTRFSHLDADPGFETRVPPDHNKLAAAHHAFATDGVVVEVPPGAVMDHPVVVEVHAVTPGTASFPHLMVRLGENAEARVLVVHRSARGAGLLVVPQVELDLGDGSNLRFLSVQSVDHAATNVIHQRIRIGRDATARVGEVGLGAKLGRLDLRVDLVGDGSSTDVVGLYFGEGSQTLDYRMVINHVGKRTSSNVFLKGAVEDDAQSVFTGLLRIEKDAVRTSAFETNRNLVLSENAKAHSVPNLEILCNDVVCGHASSVGPLEEEYLYYLQSRGLPRRRAERLLVRGFFQEVIDRLPVEGLAGPVSTEVFHRFVTAQEEGRLS